MKVLHITPSIAKSYGGPTQSLGGYVRAARSLGAEITIAAPRGSPSEIAEMEALAGAGQVHSFNSFGRAAFVASPSLVRWVASEAKHYDVIHVHGLFNLISTLSARAAIGAGAPVVIRPFGTLSRYTIQHRRGMLKRGYFAALERRNLNGASALHFTTSAERDEARLHGLDIDARAHVVPPPWIAEKSYQPRTTRASRVALFLGRMNPVKNIEALIDAWPHVLAAHAEARLIIAGSGDSEYQLRLESRVGKLGLKDCVSFAGFLTGDAKAAAFASASIFVLASHHENFGVAVLEAIGSGLPVVISRHVQLRDFVVDNKLGLVVDTDPLTLASAIVAAFDDERLHRRVSEDAASILSDNYGLAVVGDMLQQMYLDAVTQRTNRDTRKVT